MKRSREKLIGMVDCLEWVWIGDYFFSLDNMVEYFLEYDVPADTGLSGTRRALRDHKNGKEWKPYQNTSKIKQENL